MRLASGYRCYGNENWGARAGGEKKSPEETAHVRCGGGGLPLPGGGGAWRLFMTPYGTVRMQINPDVRMSVNRMDYVIGIEGLNADGVDLIASYQYTRKKVNEVSDELAERAARMGYLKEDGAIWITVDSDHEEWRVATEERLIIALEVHVGASVTVTSGGLGGRPALLTTKPSYRSVAPAALSRDSGR